MDITQNAMTACDAVGIRYKPVPNDGRWHKTDVVNHPHGKDDGRIKLFTDGLGGIVCNWTTSEQITFFTDGYKNDLSPADREAIAEHRRKADQEKAEAEQKAALEAQAEWTAATEPNVSHPYLVKKSITKALGIKQHDGKLIVPVRIDGKLTSLQRIDANGVKLFLTGGKVGGGYCLIGGAVKDRIIIAEGYGAGITVHEITGDPVAVAFGVNNLEPVARALRKRHPTSQIIIAADDDYKKDKNAGKIYAESAAKAVGGFVSTPVFSKERADDATDFNDLYLAEGIEAVRKCFAKVVPVVSTKNDDWLLPVLLPDARQSLGELDFPLAALPTSLRAAVEETARFTKSDPVAAATIGLSVLATALGKQAKIYERDGLSHFPSLFFALIADSGERKSAVFKVMEEPLSQWEKSTAGAYKAEKAKAENMAVMFDAQIDALRKQGKKTSPDDANLEAILDALGEQIGELEAKKPQMPPSPKLYDTDATEQYLVKQLHRRGGAFAVLTPEGRPLIDHILGKYSGGDGMTGDGVYLNGISGDRITRGRVGDENGGDDFVIFDPCLNVCCMVQPDKYATLAGHASLKESGLVARIWSARLKPMVGYQTESAGEKGLQEAAMQPFWKMVEDVLDQQKKMQVDQSGQPVPHTAKLSSEAAELRRQFHNRLQEQMRDSGDYADVRAIVAKATSQTAKLALVLHCAADATKLFVPHSNISGETWRNAEAIASYYLAHAVTEARAADEDILMEKARRLLAWIERMPPSNEQSTVRLVTRAAVLQSSPKPRPKAADADRILGILEDFNFIRQVEVKVHGKAIYEANPKLYNK